MRRHLSLLAIGLLSAAPAIAAPAPIDPAVQKRIDRILKATPLIDGHNDIAEQLGERHGARVDALDSGTAAWADHPLMTDMARLKAGRVGGQLWSVFIGGENHGDAAIRQTLERIDIVDRMVAAYPGTLRAAGSAAEIVAAHRAGRVASLIGVEGGHQIGESFAALRAYYRLGARYMTLTHNSTTGWADSATDAPRHGGLSKDGETVIHEMNRLGMLVDLSHVSPDTMRDALAATRAPVIFSHSSAGGVNPHPRNVPDDILPLVKANGGVVMVNAVPMFLRRDSWMRAADRAGEEARLKAIHRGDPKAVEAALATWDTAHPAPRATIADIADHIDHIARVAGPDHVGIGADFDGIGETPIGFDGVDAYPRLFAELIRRGWSDRDLAKLAGGNFLRVLRRAEVVAASLSGARPALDALPPHA